MTVEHSFSDSMGSWQLMLGISLCLLTVAPYATASLGDSTRYHHSCLDTCSRANCSSDEKIATFKESQPLPERLLFWSCEEDCKYMCMWKTVARFHENGLATPQFYGKWPFHRFLGMEEPASAIFSLFNFAAHAWMQLRLRREVPREAPMLRVWQVYGLVSFNTWFWSLVFHSHDVNFTEKMDYLCAFSVVCFNLAACLIRARITRTFSAASTAGVAALLAVFVAHVYTMAAIRFDYGLNMRVNIAVGAVNSVLWLTWAAYSRRRLRHAWRCAAGVLLFDLTVLLEILDFEPFLTTFDSHALWHLSTVPVHIVWYGFVIDDCQHLHDIAKKEEQKKLA